LKNGSVKELRNGYRRMKHKCRLVHKAEPFHYAARYPHYSPARPVGKEARAKTTILLLH